MIEGLKRGAVKVLRWSERYTKTDMVYLAKGGGWLLMGRAVGMASAFFLSIIFANFLPKELFGNYKYVLSIANALSLFTLSGMGAAVARAIAQGKEGVVREAIKTQIRWGLLGSIVSIAFCLYYLFLDFKFDLALAFFVVAFFLPFFNVYSIYSSILQGKKLFNLAVRYDVTGQILYFILAAFAIFESKQIWILIIPYLFMNSWLQKIWLWRTRVNVRLNTVTDNETVKFGKDLSWMGALNSFSNFFDQIAVFLFLGPAQTAVYSMALAPTEQLKGVFKIIGVLALPKFSEGQANILALGMRNKIIKFVIVILFVIAVYIVFAPFLYSFLFPMYTDSVKYSQIFALSLVATASQLPFSFLQGQKRTRSLYSWNMSSAAVLIFSIMFGGYFFGLWGIVVARTASRFFDFVYLSLLAKKND